jgi:diguanylate cyclase (GGDEF)-like protein
MEASMDRRILVIDDDVAIQQVLVQHLTNGHTEVCAAGSGKTGVDMARQCKPDLILLDVDMPGMNGHEVCRQLKFDPTTQGIPIAFITAAASVGDRVAGLDHGACDYILKPFDPSEVAARTRAIFRTKSTLESVKSKTTVDSVTGLGNRMVFEQHLQAELARAYRSAESLACMIIEPDQMKEITDSKESTAADGLMSDVAGILTEAFRLEDRVFRYSDRQFAVIAPNVSATDVVALSERLQWVVLSHPALNHRGDDQITISIGLAVSRLSFGRSVVDEAVEALLQAKTAGGNRIVAGGEVMELRLAI